MMSKDKVMCADTGMFLIRVALGLVFVSHGWSKIQMMDGTVSFFASLGLATFVAYLVSWVELLGGIAMILGVWTKWAGILLAIVMAGAIWYVTGAKGFMGGGGYEYTLTLLLVSLGVAFAGPGGFTVHKLAGNK